MENSNQNTNSGFEEALKLFRRAAADVPAYRRFLETNGIDPQTVTTPEDFAQIPAVTKENYLRTNPLAQLHWLGSPKGAEVVSSSSGSSGKPFFWMRNEVARRQSAAIHQEIFEDIFKIQRQETTLVIIGFAMGSWIAGTYTFAAVMNLIEEQDFAITMATPGINKLEIVRLFEEVAPMFDRVVLAGYPPFIKDVLDEAKRSSVDLSAIRLNLLFAGENFSEKWRDYVLRQIGNPDPLTTAATIYGTADAGLLGHENPFSVFVRRTAMENHALFETIFPNIKSIPSLVSYNPKFRYFESEGTNLIFSADNALPLIRYQIGDQGHLLKGSEIVEMLERHNIAIPEELRQFIKLEYLTIYGRTDVATTFYALDIYPENIRYGLEEHHFEDFLTGKFILETVNEPETQEQILNLSLELKPGVDEATVPVDDIIESVLMSLKKYNSEFSRLYQEIGSKAHPNIFLVPADSPEFAIAIKHRWNSRP